MINIHELPPEAQALVATIEAHLHEAQAMLQAGTHDADGFALRETRRRYLPETLQAFLNVPQSLRSQTNERGESAHSQLLASLTTLEAATRTHLERLAAAGRDASAVNSQFLAERFADVAPVADATQTAHILQPQSEGQARPSMMLVQSLFNAANLTAEGDQKQLLEAVAEQFASAFPRLTKIQRQLFTKNIKRIEIEVPAANGVVRYTLAATSYGFESSFARIVRNVALKTEVITTDLWIEAITDHLADFIASNRDAEARLKELFNTN